MYTTMTYSKEKIHTDLPLKYLEHVPNSVIDQNNKNKPLIIFLHGFGSNEEDLFELKSELMPDYIYLSVRAPMQIYNGSYQWFSLQMPAGGLIQVAKELSENGKLLEDYIKAAAKKYDTSADKIFLVGFSQGAIMSYELALTKPQSVRGIVALSGMILPTLESQITPGTDLKNLAVFIGHGSLDNRIPITAANTAKEILSKTSIKPEVHTYEGLGHSINQKEIRDINEWIQKTLSSKR
jgi:phospholipase/carboxylesterase